MSIEKKIVDTRLTNFVLKIRYVDICLYYYLVCIFQHIMTWHWPMYLHLDFRHTSVVVPYC